MLAITLHEGAWLISVVGIGEDRRPQSVALVGTPIYDKKDAILLGETIMPHYIKLYESFATKKEVPSVEPEKVESKEEDFMEFQGQKYPMPGKKWEQ